MHSDAGGSVSPVRRIVVYFSGNTLNFISEDSIMCGIAGIMNMRGSGGASGGACTDGAGSTGTAGGADNRADMQRMRERMVRRGPDGGGTWVSEDGVCTLGHQRLSILDLSDNGAQPMVSHSGRKVIVFNGEIYNFGEVKARLGKDMAAGASSPGIEVSEPVSFRSSCDTEVLLEAIELYGMEKALALCKGMFALGVYDTQDGTLTLARDRVGEKPLYWGWVRTEPCFRGIDLRGASTSSVPERTTSGGSAPEVQVSGASEAPAAGTGAGASSTRERFVFASDIGSIRAIEGFSNKINEDVLDLYFQYGVIPAPYSIYEDIYKLEPGTFLTVRAPYTRDDVTQQTYWSMTRAAVRGQQNLFQGTRREAADELERLLTNAIRGQMISDVPLGAFLSAGIDSTTIVSLMQQVSSGQVRTFTIGMNDPKYNEAAFAGEIARHLGTDHTEMYITEEDAKAVIPLLARMFAEPFADSSQIPTYLVSKLTRGHVTVSLSGDAGDELFCGYNSYPGDARKWGKINGVPWPLRRAAGSLVLYTPLAKKDMLRVKAQILQARSPEEIHRLQYETDPLTGRIALRHGNLPYAYTLRTRSAGDGGGIGAASGTYAPAAAAYGFSTRDDVGIRTAVPGSEFLGTGCDVTGEVYHDCMLMDLRMYHPDDILVKVDRTAMAVSLETRVPFLDRDVVEFAWTLPAEYLRGPAGTEGNGTAKAGAAGAADAKSAAAKIGPAGEGGTVGKLVLRDILYRYVPEEMVNRPKKGFSIPLKKWLRDSELREWAEDLIAPGKLRAQGLLDADIVQRIWTDFTQRGIWRDQIWYILMFQAWYEGEYECYRKTGR